MAIYIQDKSHIYQNLDIMKCCYDTIVRNSTFLVKKKSWEKLCVSKVLNARKHKKIVFSLRIDCWKKFSALLY